MNLLKLLTVGRSLNGNKTIFGKYKMTPQIVPKFASTVRPSRTAPAVESLLVKAKTMAPTDTVQTPVLAQSEAQTPAFVPSVLDKTQKIPAGKISKRMEAPVLKEDKVTLLTGIQNRISGLKKKMFPARSRKKSGSAPVQTEWPLGQVTVVRNDLTDADLEVVASKRAVQKVKSHEEHLSQAKKPGFQWIKKTSQLFKPTSPFETSRTEETVQASQPEVEKPELVGKI